MLKLNISISIYNEKGFSEIIYRNQKLFNLKSLLKKDSIEIFKFIKDCIIEFSRGLRGTRYGRNFDATKETGKYNIDPGKISEAVHKIEKQFKEEIG